MHFIWFILVGAVVGALGRLFHPGIDPMGWLLTIAIGVILAVILVALVGRMGGRRGAPARVEAGSESRGSRPRGNCLSAVSPQSVSRHTNVRTRRQLSSIS